MANEKRKGGKRKERSEEKAENEFRDLTMQVIVMTMVDNEKCLYYLNLRKHY